MGFSKLSWIAQLSDANGFKHFSSEYTRNLLSLPDTDPPTITAIKFRQTEVDDTNEATEIVQE